MITVLKIISVFLTGIIELWAAVPAGFAFKLDPGLIAVTSAAGSATSAVLVLLIGEPIRKWLLSFKKSTVIIKDETLKKIWFRYGIAGLCMISPLLLGAHFGAAIALALGGNKKTIIVWMSVSCLIWSAILTGSVVLGLSLFHK